MRTVNAKRRVYTAAALLVAISGILAACGGGGGSLTPDLGYNAIWPEHNWNGAVDSGDYSVVAVDDTERNIDPLTAKLALDVSGQRGSQLVAISAREFAGEDHAYLHLRYDAERVHPVAMRMAEQLEGQTVFLGIDSLPGVVTLGLAAIGGAPVLNGSLELCEVDFAAGAFAGARGVSAVSNDPVVDLHFNVSSPNTLQWTYSCKGDYDQNSEVNVADLTPIGIYFQADTESDNWQAAQVADGDNNGLVTVSDLTPIGVNYLERLTAYKIQGGGSQTGPFAGEDTVTHAAGVEPDGGGYLKFSYDVIAPVENAWYVVWAMDGTTIAAQHSNATQYTATPSLGAPVNLTAIRDDDHIQLNWDAPAGQFPDGYEAYAGSLPNMTDGIKMHTDTINGTSFNVPVVFSPDSEHYFGVRAVYGTERSDFSNIAHFIPGGSDAPTNLLAAHIADHVTLSWNAPAVQTPDGYNAYRGSDGAMTDALQINASLITGLAFDVPVLFSPDSEHYFAVTALYGTVESEYSNISHYDPSVESDPPTWPGGTAGIKSVIPGTAQVLVDWYEAQDATSPPVTYLVYYDEAGDFDWATASVETVAAPSLSTTIGGLTNFVDYMFGVRARDAVGNTDTNTNTLIATPVAGGVPIDTGVWQASELVDDGGAIAQMEGGWYSDVAVSAGGVIGISHYSNSAQDLIYTYGSSGNWTTEIVSNQGDTGLYTDLAFDPVTDEPCIAFHNATEARLEFARKTGSAWVVEVVDDGGDIGAFASLEFDPTDNRPAISYFDYYNSDVLYAKFNGTSWTVSTAYNGAPSLTYPSGMFTSLSFNPVTQRPAISFMRAYTESFFDQSACWYAFYTGSGWDDEEADLGTVWDLGIGTSGWASNLCHSSTGIPFIMHYDLYVDDEIHLSEARLTDKTLGFWSGDFVTWSKWNAETEYLGCDIEWYDGATYWVLYDSSTRSLDYGSGYVAFGTLDTDGRGGMPSLFIAADGTQHATYLDIDNNQLYYASKAPAAESWTKETITLDIGGTAVVGDQTSLAYHPTGYYPMISYYDASNTRLKYADKQPGSWRKEEVANARNDGGYSDMDLSITGVPYIVYLSADGQYIGLHMASGGWGAWDTEVVKYGMVGDPLTDVVGTACSIAITPTFTPLPMLAYHNDSQKWLDFAQGSAEGAWGFTTIDNSVDNVKCTEIAVNPITEQPGIACYRSISGNLYYAERSPGGAWSYVEADSNPGVGNGCSVTFSTAGKPWISYYDEFMARLKVAYIEESAWEYLVVVPPSGSTNYGRFSAIAWHPQHDRPAVAFYDSDAGKLWYVFIGIPSAPQAAVEVAGGVNLEGAYCSLRFNPDNNQPGVAYQDVTNGDLRYVERHAE